MADILVKVEQFIKGLENAYGRPLVVVFVADYSYREDSVGVSRLRQRMQRYGTPFSAPTPVNHTHEDQGRNGRRIFLLLAHH